MIGSAPIMTVGVEVRRLIGGAAGRLPHPLIIMGGASTDMVVAAAAAVALHRGMVGWDLTWSPCFGS